MKEIMIFSIVSVLLFTVGCNYDYGKYGKEKTGGRITEINVKENLYKNTETIHIFKKKI